MRYGLLRSVRRHRGSNLTSRSSQGVRRSLSTCIETHMFAPCSRTAPHRNAGRDVHTNEKQRETRYPGQGGESDGQAKIPPAKGNRDTEVPQAGTSRTENTHHATAIDTPHCRGAAITFPRQGTASARARR